ncbi:MAG: HAD hydrolase-like protein [Hyphomicrobiales bacterium]|nr:HAD hydrolase-like protein [Hyphomicrobiales bacterium]
MQSSDNFSQIYAQLDGEAAFRHYEHVRGRLPPANFPEEFDRAANLIEIADHFDVFVFDAYGVLNVGGTPISGGPECLAKLRNMEKQVFVLSNGASFDAKSNVKKFEGLGYDFGVSEVISSRMAAERALARYGDEIYWGAMSKADFSPDEIDQPTVKLTDDASLYDEVTGFLLLSTLDWNTERQQMLECSLENQLRPIIVANPDIVSPREDHMGMEPGYIAHRLVEKYHAKVEFHGKPFASVFDIVEEGIAGNISRERICMIGDTLHTDILGGAAQDWKTILVSDHGIFKGLDAGEYVKRSGIVPDWVIPSI